MNYSSPLRYPGGKAALTPFLRGILSANQMKDACYVEPFAGGGGAALELLFTEAVSEIVVNDVDPNVYCFWRSCLDYNAELVDLIRDARLNVDEWRKQKLNYSIPFKARKSVILTKGFAFFYLNRCNRSGVLNGGPIGGLAQKGDYKMDVRFNRSALAERVEKIGLYSSRITAFKLDAVAFLKQFLKKRDSQNTLVYMDPPYVQKGAMLYDFDFTRGDHSRLAAFLNGLASVKWVVSYDDEPVIHTLYSQRTAKIVLFNYFVHSAKVGRELVISSADCALPEWQPEALMNKRSRGDASYSAIAS